MSTASSSDSTARWLGIAGLVVGVLGLAAAVFAVVRSRSAGSGASERLPCRALYRGIPRFLVEDTADHSGNSSALQRACRQRAYGVIQRSRAWGDLIANHHSHSVRLSIHPQPIGVPKFGIASSTHPTPGRPRDTRRSYAAPMAPGLSCRGPEPPGRAE